MRAVLFLLRWVLVVGSKFPAFLCFIPQSNVALAKSRSSVCYVSTRRRTSVTGAIIPALPMEPSIRTYLPPIFNPQPGAQITVGRC